MNFYNLLGILNWIIAFSSFTLAFLILLKDSKKKENQAFFASSLTMGLWSISLYFYNKPSIFNLTAEQWLKITYIFVYVMVFSYMIFTYYFPKKVKIPMTFAIILYVGLSLIGMYLMFFTSTVIESVKTYKDLGLSEASMGWGYWLYSLPIAVMMFFLIFTLLKKQKVLYGYYKAQLNFYMYGALIMGTGLMTVDVALPMFFNYSKLYGISPIFTLVYFVLTGYSIVKHRLFGIKFILGKFIYYVIRALILSGFFFGAFWISIKIWGSIFVTGAILTGIGLCSIYILFLGKIDEIILKLLEKTLIYSEYDPFETINKLLKLTSTELDMSKVVLDVLTIVRQSLSTDKVGLVLFDRESRKVQYRKLVGFEKKDHRNMRELLEVVNFWDLQEVRGQQSEILVLEELISHPGERTKEEFKRFEQIIKFMQEENVAVLLPLNRKVQLNGLLLVGPKENGEAYTVQDIDLLESIVANASVAVGRALLYKEVEDFTKTLQIKVDEATADLQEKVKALEAARQRERDLLDILGHELRTPLSIIKSALGLIRMKKNKGILTDEDIDKNIDAAEESLGREIKIVDTLLGATKLEANKLDLHPEEVDIIDVIEDGIAGQKRGIEQKSLKAVFEKPVSAFPTVYADRTRIQEVFDNLLSNAVKYTDEGKITIFLHFDEKFVYVAIKDTGVGIAKQDIKKLGKKFYRVKPYSQKDSKLKMVRPGGSGLGLYVTFGYVIAMGGDVKVKSEVGKGSTFVFSIPKYKGQEVKKSDQVERDVFKRLKLQEGG